jgi:hypothetical protein
MTKIKTIREKKNYFKIRKNRRNIGRKKGGNGPKNKEALGNDSKSLNKNRKEENTENKRTKENI